jgi:hypothetical protein
MFNEKLKMCGRRQSEQQVSDLSTALNAPEANAAVVPLADRADRN